MDLFWYGLQFSVLGMIVVLFALYILALILQLFNKLFSGEKSSPTQDKGGQGGKRAPVQSSPVETKGGPASVASLQGQNPNIVAAAMGALLFTLEGGQRRRFAVSSVTRAAVMPNNWAQTGRSRLLQLRQDFVSSKRGKGR